LSDELPVTLVISSIIDMHHPQVYDTILIVEDFFLFVDPQCRCHIEPVIYAKSTSSGGSEGKPCKGFKIIRPLNSGRIEINIFGFDRDNDSMDFHYFLNDEKQSLKVIELSSRNNDTYDIEAVRTAVREIMILDRESGINPEISN
jgi:hypothetical protein